MAFTASPSSCCQVDGALYSQRHPRVRVSQGSRWSPGPGPGQRPSMEIWRPEVSSQGHCGALSGVQSGMRGRVGLPPPHLGPEDLLPEAATPARGGESDTWASAPTFPPAGGATEPPVSPRTCVAPSHLHKYHGCGPFSITSSKLTPAVCASLLPVNIPEREEVHFLRSRQEPRLALPINN